MGKRVFLFCFIKGVMRNKIEMLPKSEKSLAIEAFAYLIAFSVEVCLT